MSAAVATNERAPAGARVEIKEWGAGEPPSANLMFDGEHRFSVVLNEEDDTWGVLDHRCFGVEIASFERDESLSERDDLERVAQAFLESETEGRN